MILALAWPLAVHSYLGRFSRYLADDFCTAYLARDKGILGATHHWYVTWSGRFSYMFTLAFLQRLGEWQTSVVPAALIILSLIAFTLLANEVQFFAVASRNLVLSVLFALVIVFGWVSTSPDLEQTLFWEGGSIIYTFPLPLLGLFWWFQLRNINKEQKPAWWHYIFLVVFSFALCGFNEPFAVFHLSILGMFLVASTVFGYKRFFSHRPIWLISIVSGLAGVYVSYSAPGSALRSRHFPEKSPWQVIIQRTLDDTNRYLIDLERLLPYLLVVLSVSIGIAAYLNSRTSMSYRTIVPTASATLVTLVFTFVAAYVLIIFTILPAFFMFSSSPSPRTLNAVAFIIVLEVVIVGLVFGIWLGWLLAKLPGTPRMAVSTALAIALLAITVQTSLSYGFTYFNQRDEFQASATAIDRQRELVQAQVDGGATTVIMEPAGMTYGLSGINTNPDFWVNVCAANWFQVEKVHAP